MKYFSLQEAEALIPELEKIFQVLLDIAEKAEAKAERVRKLLGESARRAPDLAIEKSQLEFLSREMEEWLQKVVDLGALPKGLDPALVDFPFRLGNREVSLCWRLGEKSITHYHGLEEGFSGRKALPRTLH